jgi:small subunit ribosomal protein S8
MEDGIMSVMDPISDMLTRMRNAVMAGHNTVAFSELQIKVAIAKIMKEEGITNFEIADGKMKAQSTSLRLKYRRAAERRPVITGLERISRPGKQVYTSKKYPGCSLE